MKENQSWSWSKSNLVSAQAVNSKLLNVISSYTWSITVLMNTRPRLWNFVTPTPFKSWKTTRWFFARHEFCFLKKPDQPNQIRPRCVFVRLWKLQEWLVKVFRNLKFVKGQVGFYSSWIFRYLRTGRRLLYRCRCSWTTTISQRTRLLGLRQPGWRRCRAKWNLMQKGLLQAIQIFTREWYYMCEWTMERTSRMLQGLRSSPERRW